MAFGRGMKWIAWLAICAGLACTISWTVLGLTTRTPAWGEVEVLFEADRLRAGLTLYVDPIVGAGDYGPVPSRYFVTYPPVLSHVARFVPSSARMVSLRVAATLLYLFALVWPALRGDRARQSEAIAFSAYFASFWILANLATTGRPDSFALALASFALVRTLRLGTLDNLGSALFVLAAFVKPTVLGMGASVLVIEGMHHRAGILRRIIGGAAVAIALGGALWIESRGAFFAHVVKANAQSLLLSQWIANVPRLVFFAPPVFAAAWALRTKLSFRDPANARARIAMSALLGSFAWTCFMLGKIGSASNYWLEPAVATIASVAHFGTMIEWSRVTHAAFVCAQVFYVETASTRSALERIARDKHEAAFVQRVKTKCIATPTNITLSDNAGVEYLVNGRIVTTAFQLVHASERGLLPNTIWRDLLRTEYVACFVSETDLVASTPGVEDILAREFVAQFESGSFHLARHRDIQ